MPVQAVNNIREIQDRIHRKISAAVHETGRDMAETTRQNIRGQNLIDTGFMLASVVTDISSEMTAETRVGAEYAIYHELGAPRANIPPRPFFYPAVMVVNERFKRRMREALNV